MALLSAAQLHNLLHRHRLLAAVVIEDLAAVEPLGQAFVDGGLPFIEITYRSELASDAIRILSQSFPTLAVGAGTILSVPQAAAALAAGAGFLVAPSLNDQVVKFAQSQGAQIMPGVQTASEIAHAADLGLSLAKFFPAAAAGGLEALKAMAGPFPAMRFMPTGGINRDNLAAYLALPNVAACGGTWLAPKPLMAAGNFAEIKNIVAQSVALVESAVKG